MEGKERANIINDLYEKITDYEHDGENSLAVVNGVGVESIAASGDAIMIDLENGKRLVLTVMEEQQ